MKAIGFKKSLPVEEAESFFVFETEKPVATGHDILVNTKAVSVNPVDFKFRKSSAEQELEQPKVIGYDASGIVEETGEKVKHFKPGDEVFYSGDMRRPGSNAEYQLVDERIAGFKPRSCSHAEAAALPLTSLTAWELIFDRMQLKAFPADKRKHVLVIGGAGGVGSIAIQILKTMNAYVVATASRKESADWCRKMGADLTVDHHNLEENIQQEGIRGFDYILNFANTTQYWNPVFNLINPQGSIGCIVPPDQALDPGQLFYKSITLCGEFMFTRSAFQTEDMHRQHQILNEVADLCDKEVLRSTVNHTMKGFTAENLKQAHKMLESGKTIGKVAIDFTE